MSGRVQSPKEVGGREVDDNQQRLKEMDRLEREIKEITDRLRCSSDVLREDTPGKVNSLLEKIDRIRYLEALKRFSEDGIKQLKLALKRRGLRHLSTLKRDCDFETVVTSASLYPDYFTIDDIIFCLFSNEQALQPEYIQGAYPFLEEFEGFPVSVGIGLHGLDVSTRESLGISPEEANRYLDLARTKRFSGFEIIHFHKDGISPEAVLSYDKKFGAGEIYRLALSRVSPDRALELTDKQLASIGVTPKGQNPRLRRRLANRGFMVRQSFRRNKKI